MNDNIFPEGQGIFDFNVRYVIKGILWGFIGLFLLAFWNLEILHYFSQVRKYLCILCPVHWGLFILLLFLLFLSSPLFLKKNQAGRDIFLIAAFLTMSFLGISLTGGLSSPMFIFLIIGLLFSGVLLSFKTTLAVSFLAAIIFVWIAALNYFSFVKSFSGTVFAQKSVIFFWQQSFIYCSLIILIGFLTAYFSDLFKRKNVSLLAAIQDLKATQAKLIQSEKMASIGVLSSGITHELKNPITSILGFADLAWKKIQNNPASAELNELIQEIYLNSRHTRDIISNLLDFSRTSANGDVFEMVNLPQVLKDALRIIKHQLDVQNITVTENFSHQDVRVTGMGNQLQQVFLNILINSKDALPSGGEININLSGENGRVRMVFKDNGAGMPPEVLGRVFEPFFTTKGRGQGVGLGLAVSYGIISRHQGTIEINSHPGQGTEVIVTLPVDQTGTIQKQEA